MAAKSRGYEPLREDSLERCAITTEIPELPHHRRRTFTLGAKPMTFIVSILIFSLATNIFLGSKIRLLSCDGECSSFYAGLKRDIPIEIYPTTKYTGDNITEVRALWEELSGDTGVVALSAVFVEEKRLKQAMRFPWDEEKGVYLLQGFHNLHCLRTLYRYIMYTETGQPNHIAYSHALHCLDQLRQDVICNADDTPRWAGDQVPTGTGSGQVRMCKDWSKLEEWALKNTACFHHEDEVPGPMIERFKSCPDGRILWPLDDGTSQITK